MTPRILHRHSSLLAVAAATVARRPTAPLAAPDIAPPSTCCRFPHFVLAAPSPVTRFAALGKNSPPAVTGVVPLASLVPAPHSSPRWEAAWWAWAAYAAPVLELTQPFRHERAICLGVCQRLSGLERHTAERSPTCLPPLAPAAAHPTCFCSHQCSPTSAETMAAAATAAAAARDLAALVQGLRSNRASKQATAAMRLADLAAHHPASKIAILAAGGAPALVQLLHSRDNKVLGAACAAHAEVAYGDPRSQAEIAAAGGIPPLTSLLHSSDAAVVANAACALGRLTLQNASNVAALTATNCIPRLLQLLRDSSSAGVQAYASLLPGSVGGSLASCAADMIAGGGIPLLVQRLQSSELQEAAAAALAALAAHEAAAAAIAREGGIPALARLLRTSRAARVPDRAGAALATLSAHAATSSAVAAAAADCIPAAVRLLEASDCSEFTATSTIELLHNLAAASPATAAAIEAAGGRAALQRHSSSHDGTIREMVVAALRLLDEHAHPPAAPPQPRAPRVCAAEGCSNTAHLRRCGGCGRVRYCSAECSKAHWRTHRSDCKRWRAEAQAAAAAAAETSEAGATALTEAAQP